MPILAEFTFTGASGKSTSVPPDRQPNNGSLSAMTEGAGLTNEGITADNVFWANHWTGSSLDPIDYFEFTIQANSGFNLTLESLVFAERSSETGAKNFAIRSSLDNYTSDLFSSAASPLNFSSHTVPLGGQNFTNSTNPIAFRFYAWGATASIGTWRIDDLQINGSIPVSIAPTTTNSDPKIPPETQPTSPVVMVEDNPLPTSNPNPTPPESIAPEPTPIEFFPIPVSEPDLNLCPPNSSTPDRTLTGNLNDDFLVGDSENELIVGEDGFDIIVGLAGRDTLQGGSNESQFGNDGSDDWIFGNQDDDEITSGKGNDVVFAGKGNDRAWGGTGRDILLGNIGDDCIRGEAENDTVFGNTGNDIVTGGDDDDWLHGGKENDTLFGGNGNDILRGDLGNDSLVGGSGGDRFDVRPGDGSDRISDFENGRDLIGLAGGLSFDRLQFAQVGSDTLITMRSVETAILLIGVAPTAIGVEDFVVVAAW
jgi:RTX calcium-binding nonapeptide repeat (4 copies)